MKGHLARRGGIWWARLVVPARLRVAAGRREFTRSTRTHDLNVAKAVGAGFLAEWRRQLVELESRPMISQVQRLLQPAPMLAIGATISLREAAVLGVDDRSLLRIVEAGRLRLYCRVANLPGYLVDSLHLEYDPETGGVDIPPPGSRPPGATETAHSGVLSVPDSRQIASAILAESLDDIPILALQTARQDQLFVPTQRLVMRVEDLELLVAGVERVRNHMVGRLPPDQVQEAGEHLRAPTPAAAGDPRGRRAAALFSTAVHAYCTDPGGLPHDLASKAEQRQRMKGLLLFAEFMGDLRLENITADILRAFRDGPLRTVPGRANNIPKALKRNTVIETVKAIGAAGVEWPTLSMAMQRERMQWLTRLFRWLHQKEWIASNPAALLEGETGLTKAQRKEQRRADAFDNEDEGREPFTADELTSIFGQSWFATGTGAHFRKPRFWYPFEYLLPLIGLFAGLRIGEACQLHLADVRQVEGVWIFDINEATADKSLKNQQSRRMVPVHPRLIEVGLLAYCERLRAEGFRRLFPELTWARTDARYAKEPIRKMSAMLRDLGMPRGHQRTFHCFRHNANNALARIPAAALHYADEGLRRFIRYTIMGHELGKDVNTKHYLTTPMRERSAMVAAMNYDLPPIKPLDVDFAVSQVKAALAKKAGERRGQEDLGPLNQLESRSLASRTTG